MNKSTRSHIVVTEIGLLFVVVVWAANYPLTKYALSGMDPFVFNAIRYIVAAATLLILFLFRSEWRPIARGDWKRLLLTGFEANVLYQIAFIIGLSMTTAGTASVLLSTSPLWTILLNARLHREGIHKILWIGMSISLFGVLMIVFGGGSDLVPGNHEFLGDGIALCASILWALNTVLQKPLLATYSPSQLSLMMISIGAIGLSILSIPTAVTFGWATTDWTCYGAAILSGALSIGICNAIWSRGVLHIGPGKTSNFNNLVPVLALAISYFTLHEKLMPVQLIGAGITVIGVWIARR